jgi:hypothetical protein
MPRLPLLILAVLLCAPVARADDCLALNFDGRELSYDGPEDGYLWLSADALTVSITHEPGGILVLRFDFSRSPTTVTLAAYQHPGGAVDLIGRVTLTASGKLVGCEGWESYPSWRDVMESDAWLATDLRTCFRALDN